MGKAATLAFSYDPSDFTVSSGTLVVNGNSITVSPGATVTFGVQVLVSDPNSTVAYHGVYDSTPTSGAHHFIQPANLGLASFGYGFSTSDATNAPLDVSNVALDLTGTLFGGSTGTGTEINVPGNVDIGTITGNGLAGNVSPTTAAAAAPLGYGGGTAAELFNTLQVDLSATASGTYTITPNTQDGYFAYVAYNSGGTTSTLKPSYKNVTVTTTDTLTVLPALTIVVQASTSSVSVHPIISLVAGSGNVQTNYGSGVGTLALTGVGHGSYNVATANFAETQTGSVSVTGFNPVTDEEIYALKLSNGSGAILNNSTNQAGILTNVMNDINGQNGNATPTLAQGTIVASLVTGVFSSLFPGYDILLTVNGFSATSGAELGFDFSSDPGEVYAPDQGLSVTSVAAVPEPATAAGIVLGAAGLLLGRRRNKAVVA